MSFGFDIRRHGRSRGRARRDDVAGAVRESVLFDLLIWRDEIERSVWGRRLHGNSRN